MNMSDDDFLPEARYASNISVQSDEKKKRGRPKGSKNKTESSSKRKFAPTTTELQESVPSKMVPKIVLKINVSKGTVERGNDVCSSGTLLSPKEMQNHKQIVKKKDGNQSYETSKFAGLPTAQEPQASLPLSSFTASNELPRERVRRCITYSSTDSESSTEDLTSKLKKSRRAKLLKLFIPSDNGNVPSAASSNTEASTLGSSNEHERKAERLQKRFRSAKKSPKKKKKRRASYYTLKSEVLEDNSARSSGSSSCSDYKSWEQDKLDYLTSVANRQMHFSDSSPEKGKRVPSPSPPTSPESNNTTKKQIVKGSPSLKNVEWSADQLNPAKETNVKFLAQVKEFFQGYTPPSSLNSSAELPVRFPVVHEANCCVQWRKRSAARGKQPAGRGTRKRKGICTGYLACPCQNGAGPSSALPLLPSFHDVLPPCATSSQTLSVAATSASTSSLLDEDIIKLANEALVAEYKLKPQRVLAIMDISDDSDKEPLQISSSIKSPSTEEVVKIETPPSPCLNRRVSSDSSDVEFVPGPPIEEIVVSDDSNDIIFVSETHSPMKTSTKPKKDESSNLAKSADIIFDFSNPPSTSPHSSFLRKKLPTSPLVHSSSNDILKAEAELLSNPICALPPPENLDFSFENNLNSLYPVYSKNSGQSVEPLDFNALLDFEAETLTAQNFERYSPCLPDVPINDFDRSDEIINISSPERPAPPEPIPEKNDGLVVWECPVCFEPKGDETILATTDCTHLFCDPCIRKVAAMYGKCPVCQCSIKENNIHPFRFHGYKF